MKVQLGVVCSHLKQEAPFGTFEVKWPSLYTTTHFCNIEDLPELGEIAILTFTKPGEDADK